MVLEGVAAPLAREGKEGIPAALALAADYCLAREDLEFMADVTKWKSGGAWARDPMKPLETQVKSAFTRAFNAQHIKPRTGFKLDPGTKKRGRGAAAAGPTDEAADDEEPATTQAEEEEEEELDPALVRQKVRLAWPGWGFAMSSFDGDDDGVFWGGCGSGEGRWEGEWEGREGWEGGYGKRGGRRGLRIGNRWLPSMRGRA